MKAFDADVLTLINEGNLACIQKVALIPAADQVIPIVAAEELLRGRMNVIRQAQAAKSNVSVERAYELLDQTLCALKPLGTLPLTPQAEALAQSWRKQKIKVGISDLRIAAICVVHSATLLSRNRRDFDQVPGLMVEYW